MTDCIRWEGTHRKEDGRPILKKRYAYRVLWEEANYPLPRRISLHHKCENSWCVNIEHLEPMLQADHIREHGLPGDWGQAQKTQCPSGHEYSTGNTYVFHRKDGSTERHCKTCRKKHKAAYRERQRKL